MSARRQTLESRRARVRRHVAKRPPEVDLDVAIVRREVDDPVLHRDLVRFLAALLTPGRKP